MAGCLFFKQPPPEFSGGLLRSSRKTPPRLPPLPTPRPPLCRRFWPLNPRRRGTFEFIPGIALRVINRDGDPWFIAKDVCEALGFAAGKAGTGPFLTHLDADEKQSIGSSYACGGLHPQTAIINESGLYSLILKSRKPEAQRFKKWVTSVASSDIR